jgi:hypothetical protein
MKLDLAPKLKDVNLDNKTLSYLVQSYYKDVWEPTKKLAEINKNSKWKE